MPRMRAACDLFHSVDSSTARMCCCSSVSSDTFPPLGTTDDDDEDGNASDCESVVSVISVRSTLIGDDDELDDIATVDDDEADTLPVPTLVKSCVNSVRHRLVVDDSGQRKPYHVYTIEFTIGDAVAYLSNRKLCLRRR